jgi:integrase
MAKRPVSGSKKPRTKLLRVDARRSLDLVEFDRVKTWALGVLADAETDPRIVRNAAIVLVLLGTAARRFELCSFRCGDFRRSFETYRCYFEAGKGNIEAEITISEETWHVVQRWLTYKGTIGESIKDDAPLFCGRRKEFLSVAQLHNIWDAIRTDLKLERRGIFVGVHTTRHTAGLLLLRSTKSLVQVSEFMRHGSVEVTERFYKHVLSEDVAAGLTKAGL